jgi:hypothetical protein
MGLITVKVSDELERTMNSFKLNWSEVAFRAIEDKAMQLKRLKQLSSKIKLSDSRAKEIADKLNDGVARRFFKEVV